MRIMRFLLHFGIRVVQKVGAQLEGFVAVNEDTPLSSKICSWLELVNLR